MISSVWSVPSVSSVWSNPSIPSISSVSSIWSIWSVWSVPSVWSIWSTRLRFGREGFPQVQILEDRTASALPAPPGAPACALHAHRRQAGNPLRKTPPPPDDLGSFDAPRGSAGAILKACFGTDPGSRAQHVGVVSPQFIQYGISFRCEGLGPLRSAEVIPQSIVFQ